MSKMLPGSLWMIGLRWSVRAIGLVSTVILARLLTPADFGIVAMGSLVVGLLAVFSELGAWQHLMRTKDPGRDYYDTAWTVTLLQSLFVGAVVFLCAPYAAAFFHEPRVEEVIRWLSLSAVVGGFRNIGVINFRKDLEFDKDFKFELLLKFSAFVITISLAFYFRTYWALVFGVIGGSVVGVIWSYVVHPYRPRLCLALWREFLTFSMWVTPAGIATFFNKRADTLIVGHIGSTAELGVYNVASELSGMATNEIIQPIGRALYPNYAKLKEDPEQLLAAFVGVLKTVAIICCSFGVGLALVAEDFVMLVLGDQWSSAVPLVRWLAIFGALGGIAHVLGSQIFVVMGREKLMFVLMGVRLCIFTSCVSYAGFVWGEMELVAAAATLSTAFYLVILSFCIRFVVPVSPLDVACSLVRPLAAAGVMSMALLNIDLAPTDIRIVSLAADGIFGCSVFLATLMGLWVLSGRPSGPEKTVVDMVGQRLMSPQTTNQKND